MQVKGIARDNSLILSLKPAGHGPEEFAGLLQEKDGIITEVLILPELNYDTSAVLRLYMMPNMKATGSVHSHPGHNRSPLKPTFISFRKQETAIS